MATCARCGRCFVRRAPFSARSTGPEICQFDLWEPKAEVPVGHGQTRKGYVVVACLGYSRAGAGALIFSKQTPDLLFGIRRCLWSLGALSQTLVWDRQSGLHAGGGRPTSEFAAFCGALRVDWSFCEPRDPQAKGVVERLQDFLERSFEPGRRFANELDFQLQLDTWFTQRYQQAAAHTQAAGDQHHPAGEPGRGVHHAGRVQRSGRGPHNRRKREGRDQQGVLVDRFCGCMRACRDAQTLQTIHH
jgi:hypothetical protein